MTTPRPAAKWDVVKARIAEVQGPGGRRQAFSKLIAVQTTYTGEHHYQAFGLADYMANQKNGK